MNCLDYSEIVAAHVDGALLPEESRATEAHLEECPHCLERFIWERKFKSVLKKKISLFPVRAGLKEKVISGLAEPPRWDADRALSWLTSHRGLMAAFALLLLSVLPYLSWKNRAQQDFFAETILHYHRVVRGIIDPPDIASSLPPRARLLDLSPWGYRVLARHTTEAGGKTGRVFVYRGENSEYLLAQEFEGVEITPPRHSEGMQLSNVDFVSYTREGINLVAWKDKDLLCIIASELPKEKLLDLAQQIAARG